MMLESLILRNFTAFPEADFEFAPGLNVIVGENGTGKTHILKVAYSCVYVFNEEARKAGPSMPIIPYLKAAVAQKLSSVFKPDELGRLVRRSGRGRQRADVSCRFSNSSKLEFSLHSASKSGVTVEKTSWQWLDKLPVYLPTRELLTIYPGFVSLYETTHLPFEETWRDTCVLLGAPLARGPRENASRSCYFPWKRPWEAGSN